MRMRWTWVVALALVTCTSCIPRQEDDQQLKIGAGIADVTGPAVEIGMMGYAAIGQNTAGIHMRLFSRAFIFESAGTPVVFVSIDIGMVDQAIKNMVVRRLKESYGGRYNMKNVLLSGTHTHSGPGGYIQYVLYSVTSLGFNRMNFDVIVDGIVQSIERAHENLKEGKVFLNRGELMDANLNRSPTSYKSNPIEERNKYKEMEDKTMTLLRLESMGGEPIGSVNWFSVHPTSMNNTNKLISGDNKGYASILFESLMNPQSRPGKGRFVAAFAETNAGDTSPNILGARCIDTGLPCEMETSTCNGFSQKCIALGPGENGDMMESTKIIATRQFNEAYKLFEDTEGSVELYGPVQYIHQAINMTNYEVQLPDGSVAHTCKGALGYSFAAGTTDGPGAFDFTQGTIDGNPFWDAVRDFLLVKPTPEQEECHKPKPILLDTGESYWPYEWTPSVVETQILRIGDLFIVSIPGEVTTMAGRRLVNRVKKSIIDNSPVPIEPTVIIAALSNVYTHYITTFEEYQVQRYEAASTLYGPHTLEAYIQQYEMMSKALVKREIIPDGPAPPDLLDKQWSFIPPVVMDAPHYLRDFGHCTMQPPPIIFPEETVRVKFVSGNLRNDAMREGTFLIVEKQISNSTQWRTIATDSDLNTRLKWKKLNPSSFQSEVEIEWDVPSDIAPGFYRIRHFGYYKPFAINPRAYSGETFIFQILKDENDTPAHNAFWSPLQRESNRLGIIEYFSTLIKQNRFF